MKFKGTIVITDPCYLGIDMPKNKRDWWESVGYGDDLGATGLTTYISEDTLYGDWSCNTYKGKKEDVASYVEDWNKHYFEFFDEFNMPDITNEEKEKLRQDFTAYSEDFFKKYTIGQFCADAGMVCVVYLDEVAKFNPNFENWAKTHKWCATIIEDFDGDVEYVIDENDEAHIVGVGNVNFYTSQSGL